MKSIEKIFARTQSVTRGERKSGAPIGNAGGIDVQGKVGRWAILIGWTTAALLEKIASRQSETLFVASYDRDDLPYKDDPSERARGFVAIGCLRQEGTAFSDLMIGKKHLGEYFGEATKDIHPGQLFSQHLPNDISNPAIQFLDSNSVFDEIVVNDVILGLLAQLKEVDASLFDAEFYRSEANILQADEARLFTHYLNIGWKDGLDPSPLFSTLGYLRSHTDVKHAQINPLLHFIQNGRAEGRAVLRHLPSSIKSQVEFLRPHIDEDYYRAQTGQANIDCAHDYVLNGAQRCIDPHPDFSTEYYLKVHADVRDSGVNPYLHFLKNGRHEGRQGHAEIISKHATIPTSPRILFIGHSAYRAGAEIMLLSLIKWYAEHTNYIIDIVLLKPGPLVDDFAALGNLYVVNGREDACLDKAAELLSKSYAYIYCNTVASFWFLDFIGTKFDLNSQKIIAHVHELDKVLEEFQDEVVPVIDFVDYYIAASSPVSNALAHRFKIPQEQILLHESFVQQSLASWNEIPNARMRARSELGIPQDAKVVVGCGSVYWRKNPTMFVDTAEDTLRRLADPNLFFIWIGDGPDLGKLTARTSESEFSSQIRFVGGRSNAAELLACGDVFFLSSEEDPFPLVCLEAAEFAIPIVCFSDATGMTSFVKDDAGVCIDDMNAASAAGVLRNLLLNEPQREALGFTARRRVTEHYSVQKCAPRLFLDLREKLGIRPQVSVIIPSYNHGQFIGQRIESVLAQDFYDIEVKIADDQSPDNSWEVIQQYSDDPRVDAQLNRERVGSAFAQWLTGAKQARGHHIWIAESDDFCTPNFVSAALAGFQHPQVSLSHCRTVITDVHGRAQHGALDPYFARTGSSQVHNEGVETGIQYIRRSLGILCSIVNASAVLFERDKLIEALAKAQGFEICGDWMVYLSLCHRGRIAYTEEATNFFRRHSTSVVHRLEGTARYFTERRKIIQLLSSPDFDGGATARLARTELKREWERFSQKRSVEDLPQSFETYLDGFFHEPEPAARPLKIGFYIHGLLNSTGGIEKLGIALAEELSLLGHEVTLFCRLWGNATPIYRVPPGVKVVPVFDENRAESTALDLERELILRKIDVFVPMLSEWLFEPIVQAAQGAGVCTIASEHNDPQRIVELWWSEEGRNSVFSQVDGIHLILNRFTDSLTPEQRSKTKVIPNPLIWNAGNDENRPLRGKKKRIISVGRLSPQKRFDRLIEAFASIDPEISDGWCVDIFGDGQLRSELDELIERLGVSSSVTLRGTTDQIESEYLRSDIFVLPSEFEAFGLVVIEARRAGLPCVVYHDCNGPNELVEHDKTGLLANDQSAGDDLATQLSKLMLRDDYRAKLASESAKGLEEFGVRNVAARWNEFVHNTYIKV